MRRRLPLVCTLVFSCVAQAEAFTSGPDGFPVGVVWLSLTAEQRLALPGDPVVRLTPEQQGIVERTQGVRARWMEVLPLEVLRADCTCGSQNLAVLDRERIGVLPGLASPALSPEERGALLKASTPSTTPSESLGWEEPHRGPLGALLQRTEAAAATSALAIQVPLPFQWTPTLAPPWHAARVDLGRPLIWGPESPEDLGSRVPALLDSVKLSRVPGRRASWPETGAVLERGDEVVVLVPAASDHEATGFFAAWLLLNYRSGRLVHAVLLDEGSLGQSFGFSWRGDVFSLRWSERWWQTGDRPTFDFQGSIAQ